MKIYSYLFCDRVYTKFVCYFSATYFTRILSAFFFLSQESAQQREARRDVVNMQQQIREKLLRVEVERGTARKLLAISFRKLTINYSTGSFFFFPPPRAYDTHLRDFQEYRTTAYIKINNGYFFS